MKPQIKPTWIIVAMVLILVTLACTFSVPFNLRGTTEQPGDELIPETSQEIDLTAEMLESVFFEDEKSFLLPEMTGMTILLEGGAALFVPEGALPVGTGVDAYASEAFPPLPEGIRPVGKALVITGDAQPQSPVLLRMPIPAGITDPATLMILRVESDGMITFLMTDVDGSDLVAFTPGFSKFCAVELIGEFMRDLNPWIRGVPIINPGQAATYQVDDLKPGSMINTRWTVIGAAEIQHQDLVSATIVADQNGGTVTITYSGIDQDQGLRIFGSRTIMVRTPEMLENFNRYDDSRGFGITVTSNLPKVVEGESLEVVVNFYGIYRLPILWEYRIDNCQTKTDMITSADQSTKLSFFCSPGKYRLFVFAEYLNENNVFIRSGAGMQLEVLARPMTVQLVGPAELEWRQEGVRAVFTAEASGENPEQGDAQKAQYDFSWRVLPGGEWVNFGLSDLSVTGQEFTFNQPGDYRVEVQVKNQAGQEVRAALPVMVTGGEALSAQILSWPEQVSPDEPADVRVRISGGTRVLGGKKGPYTVSVYWGDGSFDMVDPAAISEDGGASFITLSHSWQEPNTYTVMVFVEDPTGSIAYAEADIDVQEPKPDYYTGEVIIAIDPQDRLLNLIIHESQVDITVTNETVSAIITFTFSSQLYIADQNNFELNCVGFSEYAFSGEGPLTNPLSLVMAQTHFKFSKVGPTCDKWQHSDPVGFDSITLDGTFNADGSFMGNMGHDQTLFRFFGVSANKVEE